MALTLYNTLTRRLEPFTPFDPSGRRVGMYCCGPTVHDFAHIGNFKTFVLADLLRRYLEFKGFEVDHVMNVTDVEDKIIRRVRESGVGLREFTARYESAFFEDHRALNCLPPSSAPRATESMDDILALIARLLERGLAYQAPDGSVYFSIAKYRGCGCRYGQLVNLDFEQMRPGERVARDDYGKEAVADFALWKARVPEDGDVCWPSPWGEGRPGWHIECSAMSMKRLGPSFDLHLGGEDLVFPHHEDEIAQSEGAALQEAGKPFVKHWVHAAFLLVEGRKMSKSLGNFFTLRDLLAKGFSGREIRQLLVSANYRESFNFTQDGLVGARAALTRIDECAARLKERSSGAALVAGPVDRRSPLLEAFSAAMDDDLNVSAAWAAVFGWVRERNRGIDDGTLTPAAAATALGELQTVLEVFGLARSSGGAESVPAAIEALARGRQEARAARDFRRADAIREELKGLGWVVEDTSSGPKLKRL